VIRGESTVLPLDLPVPRPVLSGRALLNARPAPELVERMFALLASHFVGVDPEVFRRDLAEKNAVVLLEDSGGELRGFSTFRMYETRVSGRPETVVCSGDTIVEPSAWGSPALPRAWIRAVHALRYDFPRGDLHWLLLTSGFRTYRFLSVFCRRFYPRYEGITPAPIQELLDAVSSERYGPLYDRASGRVRFAQAQVLRPELVDVPEGRRQDPDVRFFLERNPGYAAGDELVSFASLAEDNLTAAARRMLR
jgi:hypothetical protein